MLTKLTLPSSGIIFGNLTTVSITILLWNPASNTSGFFASPYQISQLRLHPGITSSGLIISLSEYGICKNHVNLLSMLNFLFLVF
jgi:hypothetical protein